MIFIFMVLGARDVISFCIRSPIPDSNNEAKKMVNFATHLGSVVSSLVQFYFRKIVFLKK